MPNDSSDVSWYLFALFALQNSRRYLQFGSIRQHSLHLTQLGAQKTQKEP